METAAIRSWSPIVHDPPIRRDDVAGSAAVTELPTEKTVQAPHAAAATGGSADTTTSAAPERLAVKTGFERDLPTGSIVYRWTDETTGRVLLEIPKSDKIRSRQAYEDHAAAPSDHATLDRSI